MGTMGSGACRLLPIARADCCLLHVQQQVLALWGPDGSGIGQMAVGATLIWDSEQQLRGHILYLSRLRLRLPANLALLWLALCLMRT